MPTSEERFARQHPFGPPPSFRPASPCAGIDRPVSGPMTVTPGPFGTPPLTPCGAAGKSVSLRVRAFNPYPRHSHGLPGSFSKTNGATPVTQPRTPASPRFPSAGCNPFEPRRVSPPGFRHFSPPSRGAFQLSLTVLVRYRSRDVFRLGSRLLPSSHARQGMVLWNPDRPSPLRVRGRHPLWRRFPTRFRSRG